MSRLNESLHIRWAIRRDMAEILDIENRCFEFPWSEEEFIRCLRGRNCVGMVADMDDRVVGFMLYELHRTRLHILNFAVHPGYRRIGIGAAMVDRLKRKVGLQHHPYRNRLMLEVRDSNLGAQLFFRSQGFRAVSVLRKFYERLGEPCGDDAYVMQYRVPVQQEVHPC